jgi:predicted membrane protein
MASSANVTIAMGLGKLRIGALDQSSDLIAGEIAYPDRNSVAHTFSISGETATFTLREQDSQATSLVKYRDDAAIWDLRLSTATPMRLTIEAGVGESTIDLAQLHVTDLDIQAGIGNTTLTLPRQGQLQVRVEGGVGNTTIRVPAGVAVRLTSTTGLGNISVPTSYWRQGDVAVSPDYDTAANRVELIASGGIGNITIQQSSQ